MRFDLRVRYEGGHLIVESQAAHHLETFVAIVCLSREVEAVIEQIYSVGVPVDEVRKEMSKDPLSATTTYRFIDPFSSANFDGDIASKAVSYLFVLTRRRLFPPARVVVAGHREQGVCSSG